MRQFMPTLTILIAISLSACATSYDPNRYYDLNAIEKIGRVTGKSVAKVETRFAGDSMTANGPEKYGLPENATTYATAFVLQELFKKESKIPIYAYTIRTEERSDIVVFSEFPAHNIGDCVKTFLSERPDYPRIAVWSGCKP